MKKNGAYGTEYVNSCAIWAAFLVLLISAPFAYAQGASCKAVVEASNLMARTANHIYSTQVSAGRSTETESISMPAGVYWKAAGIWHMSRTTFQQNSQDTIEANRNLADCQRLNDEVVNGEPTTVYSEVNKQSGGKGKLWVSKKSGFPIRTEVVIGPTSITTRIEYSNVQAPSAAK
jgi:hypothetical protein